MKIERHYLYQYSNSTLEKILKESLPNNCWKIDDRIKFVKQYESYCSIKDELEYINTLISKLTDYRVKEHDLIKSKTDSDFWLKKSLFQSVIIGYTRCFNSTNKNGRISINEDFIRKKFPENPNISLQNAIKFHRWLLTIRNKYIAHADESEFEKTIGFIEFSYDGKILESKFSHVSVGLYSFNEDEITNLIILTSWLLKQVREKQKVLLKKVKNELTDEGLMRIGALTLKNND